MMTEYRKQVMRTAGEQGNMALGGLGLTGEAGEVADEIKKVCYHAKEFDRAKMLKELGDVRWYLEYLAWTFGMTMAEIEDANVAKLAARYPEGFREHRETALSRDEEHA